MLDKAFTAGYVQYQIRNDNGLDLKWYSATSKAVDFANELIKRERLYAGALKNDKNLSTDVVMDMVLFWFAIDPQDFKGGTIIPRIKVPAEVAGSNIIEFYFKELNNIDFILNLDLILEQLAIDGNLYRDTDDGWQLKYSITYKGKKFFKNGGYKAIGEMERHQQRTQTLKDFLLIGGSWGAFLAGGGLLYFEYVKLNHHNPYGLGFWQISLGVSILLLLAVLWIMLRKWPNKLKQTT